MKACCTVYKEAQWTESRERQKAAGWKTCIMRESDQNMKEIGDFFSSRRTKIETNMRYKISYVNKKCKIMW